MIQYDDFGIPLLRATSYGELRSSGLSRSGLRNALHEGLLIRARRDVYVSASEKPAVRDAAGVGGRLDCISALRELGVFVLDHSVLHIQTSPTSARLRSPRDRRRRLDDRHAILVHWRPTSAERQALLVPVVEAVIQSVLCQRPRAAIATLDSVLNKRFISEADLDDIFAALPQRLRPLRAHVDGRAEAGSETIARLLLRAFGRRIELQKWIPGVGRVDLVIDGWLVVECDSKAFHESWSAQQKDRDRDLALAALGYVCIRPTAMLIFEHPDQLLRAVRGLLAAFGRP